MNDERKALRETVRRFMAAEVLPELDRWERGGELPRELHKKAGELGLLGVAFPEAVGGSGGSLADAIAVVEAGEDVIAEVCFAKNTAVEAGAWVCDQALQLHGGLGYLREAEVERQYRDQTILAIGGGSTEIMTNLAAKRLGFTG